MKKPFILKKMIMKFNEHATWTVSEFSTDRLVNAGASEEGTVVFRLLLRILFCDSTADWNLKSTVRILAKALLNIRFLTLKMSNLSFILSQFFRHGMRAPDFLYPKDPNPANIWKEGLGRLTKLGKYQNYALGRQLRLMYKDFITSNPQEVRVLSAKRNRCILSALCHMAALYAPDENWQFVPDFPWQPIPVKYESIGNDKYLGIDRECPAARAEANNISNSDEGKEIMESHKEMFKDLQHFSGFKIGSLTDAEELAEILAIEKANNFTIPSWAPQYWKELDYINHAACYLRVQSKKYQRLRAGPLLGYIKKKMEHRIDGRSRKVHVYSGHKKTVTAVLGALDVYNKKEPPFCATIIFELYKEREGNSVRLLYFNSTSPENGDQIPHVLKLPKCEEFCPFENFVRVVEEVEPTDWENECQL